MNYVYFANGRVGYEALRWLVERREPPRGLVVHPEERGKYRNEMLVLAKTSGIAVREVGELRRPDGLTWLADCQPDWIVSVYFGYVLTPDVLEIPRCGAVNLHPGLLPFNRGAYPNVWSIVEHTPAGVTLHMVDAGIDTGDILAQREVPVAPTDSGATLYAKLEQAALVLFEDTWPALCGGTFERRRQPGEGTFHRLADVARIDRIDPNQQIRAGDLIDVIRARTFPPYRGAYLDLGDHRIYLRLELIEESTASDMGGQNVTCATSAESRGGQEH